MSAGLYITWKTSGRHTGEMCGLLWKSIRPKEYLAQHLVVDWELHWLTVGLNVLDLTVQLYHRDVIVQSWIGYVGSHHRALSSRCHCTDCRRGSQDDNWKVKTISSDCNSASYILHFQKNEETATNLTERMSISRLGWNSVSVWTSHSPRRICRKTILI